MKDDYWDYDKKQYLDKRGNRWFFVSRYFWSADEDDTFNQPYALYFRDDERTEFGVVRFEKSKDNPYQYPKLIDKIMNDAEFRKQHLDTETKEVWLKSWK